MASTTLKILHVAGYESCGFYAKTLSVLRSMSILFPTRLKVVPHGFRDRTAYRAWLIGEIDDGNAGLSPVPTGGFRQAFVGNSRALVHSSSPFVWFGKADAIEPVTTDIDQFLGGSDDTLEWCRTFVSPVQDPVSARPIANMVPDGHTPDHSFDYDLIVIGGGSGGMAAAKEAASFGAKVACLDFVKPSPKGTTWGLGGTCVNVGCIPKKLFHGGALLNDAVRKDSAAFGICIGDKQTSTPGDGGYVTLEDPKTTVEWSVLRENILNYIRGLNFKYRVRLREKEVTYLNKLATFVDKNTIEAVDKKGKSNKITASRYLIAVGGRPAPLACEGGELAISSDDVFFLENSPGKTLCVGASYISLECAGFLAGLGLDVTVAVRSILLRGFDRECTNRIEAYMQEHGVRFRHEVTPQKLEKTKSGRVQVTFSDGSKDEYDTVLAAIGRLADTDKLGLSKLGVKTNPKNLRILGTFEQSDCPNVYVVGDVLDGTPELTPVAIQAGQLLMRRLFGNETEQMDYVNICTTVFTPIEYACVGLSEDDAIAKFGVDNIEVYHREFVPLEWTLSLGRGHSTAFAKIICDKTPDQNVLGIHYVGPNAGEVMQGYGVAMKQGLTYKNLTDTVGIHPTSSEEIVTLSVTKSSGEDAAAGGC